MLVFFTDLDGSLLDHDTYDWQPARPALDRLLTLGHAVIQCTSKARAEVEELRAAMGIQSPFIVENGGAVFVPAGYFGGTPTGKIRDGWEILEFGAHYPILVDALSQAAEMSGVSVRGFAAMTVEEIAARTGLPLDVARLSKQREYDEPFVVEAGEAAALCAAIEAMGFSWTRGGRFYHIIRGCDKGKAVAALADLYKTHRAVAKTVGLGDGLNDAGFLREVDSAWLIPSKRTADLLRLVPGAKLTASPGPAGWAEAVLDELELAG
jgi:mannosyl-3-phosphoglycerate phosphatase